MVRPWFVCQRQGKILYLIYNPSLSRLVFPLPVNRPTPKVWNEFRIDRVSPHDKLIAHLCLQYTQKERLGKYFCVQKCKFSANAVLWIFVRSITKSHGFQPDDQAIQPFSSKLPEPLVSTQTLYKCGADCVIDPDDHSAISVSR